MDPEKQSLNARLLFELGVKNLNFEVICDYFGIPEKSRNNPNCGEWIVKWIKMSQYKMQTKRPDELFGGSATPSTTFADENKDVSTT
jgi:hypothetical protein